MRRPSSTGLFLGGLGLLSTGAVLVAMALLTRAEPRSGQVDAVTGEEPLLVPADPAAMPEKQASGRSSAPATPPGSSRGPRAGARHRPAPPTRPHPEVASEVRSRHVEEEESFVDGETLRRALEEVEETFSPLLPRVGEALSGQPGTSVRVSWDAGVATLDAQGFTLTELDPHQSFGLQAGDTIVSVNGHRVSGLGSAWWILQIARNLDVPGLRLEIHRRGARLFKTYRVAGR